MEALDNDDNELLRQYLENQAEDAFAALIQRHVHMVYSVAFRHVKNAHQAEEITQAVFILLARKSQSLRKGTILVGWLHHTARLTAANFLRTEIHRAQREQEYAMQSQQHEPEFDPWLQIAPLLDAAIGGLSQRDRNAVTLRFFYGKSLAEVGAALGTNDDTARKRVERALEKLRRYFTKRGIKLSTAALAAVISANSVQAAPGSLAAAALAASQGHAAGNSTLALCKSTLKLMAWTKMKTAAITAVGVLLLGSTAVLTVKEIKQPADYNGKSVEYWVHTALWGMTPTNAKETYGALRHIGAPAAAMLIPALTQTNSPPENLSFPAAAVRQNAFAALEQMGPAAKSQVPALIALLKYDDKDVRIWATLVLADIGPAAKAAIPALMEETKDANYAGYAKTALRHIKR